MVNYLDSLCYEMKLFTEYKNYVIFKHMHICVEARDIQIIIQGQGTMKVALHTYYIYQGDR